MRRPLVTAVLLLGLAALALIPAGRQRDAGLSPAALEVAVGDYVAQTRPLLPMRLDSVTEWTGIAAETDDAGAWAIVFRYRVTAPVAALPDPAPVVCADAQSRRLLENGVRFVFEFDRGDSGPPAARGVAALDCPGAPSHS